MSKRQNDGEGTSSSKISKQSSVNEIPALPVEIIMKIILYLNEAKDVKSCLELSKEIRHMILKTPKIMKKFQIVLECNAEKEKYSEFLSNYGLNVTTLKIKGSQIKAELLSFILEKVPNLEEFTFEPYSMLDDFERSFELPKLKKLTFLNDNFDEFLLNGKKLDNLECLSIYQHRNDYDDLLTDFVVKLDKLKELHLIYYNYKKNPEDFPTRDIRNEVNFKLTALSHSLNFNYIHPVNENFILFFASQAEYLKELKFNGDQVGDIYDIMFRYCKNLEKLSVHKSEYADDSRFFCEPNDFVLENVKHFETVDLDGRDLEYIYGKLPNLKSLDCISMDNIEGIYEKLENLKIYNLRSAEIKLPNLKSLTCENVENLTNVAPNIEELRMMRTYVRDSKDLLYLNVLKTLKSFEKLQTFYADFYSCVSKPDYKISIDMVKKQAMVSLHLLDDYKDFSEILRDNFKDFNFNYCQ